MIDGVFEWSNINRDDTVFLLMDVINSIEVGYDLQIVFHNGTAVESCVDGTIDESLWEISFMDGDTQVFSVLDCSLYWACKNFLLEMRNHQ